MKKMMTALAAVTLAMGMTACAGDADTADTAADTTANADAGSIAGTWKANPETAQSENDNSSYLLTGEQFTCNSCLPPYSMTADGKWQELDRPGVDLSMMEIVDANTVKTSGRLKGKVLGSSVWTVSADGKTMTQEFTNLDGKETTTGSRTYNRAAAGPDGAHLLSGEWTPAEYGEISDAALIFTYAIDGDTITSTGNSGGYTATLGGDAVTPEGDETGGTLKVEKVGDNMFRETYSRDGEVTNVTEMTIAGDTLTAVSTDPRDGSVFRYTATRQK